jgi:nucleoside-diphosphate-sugar epimerase
MLDERDSIDLLLNKYPRILFTGSSGWLGREILDQLNLAHKNFKNNEIVFSGSENKLLNFKGFQYKQIEFFSLDDSTRFDLIIHCAFLTQDKLARMPLPQYVEINQMITSKIVSLAQNGNPSILALSSGAVELVSETKDQIDSYSEYGKLKKEMEDKLTSLSNAHTLVSRIWNVSGNNLIEPEKYAIGQFIKSALSGQDIFLRSNGRNLRSFIPASELFKGLIEGLISNQTGIVNSGGVRCSILELAQKTQLLLNRKVGAVFADAASKTERDYFAPNSFNLDSNLFLKELKIEEQILTTSKSAVFKKN